MKYTQISYNMIQSDMNQIDIRINRQALNEILRVSQNLLDRKSEQEILEMHFKKKHVNIVISDSIASISAKIELEDSANVTLFLQPSEMHERLRKIESEFIIISICESEVIIKYQENGEAEHGFFSLHTISPHCPTRHIDEDTVTLSVEHDIFVQNLKMIKTTMALEDIRDQFRGVSMITKDNQITLWTSDGIKMAITKLNFATTHSFSGILPRRLIDAICSIVSHSIAAIKTSKRRIIYELDGFSISSPLINANMLDYEQIFNRLETNYTELIIDSGYFTKKLDKIMIVSRNEGAALMVIGPQCSLSSIAPNQNERAEIEFHLLNSVEKELKIYLNPSNILSFVRNFKGNIFIRIYPESNNIIVFKDEYPIYLTKLMRNPNYS